MADKPISELPAALVIGANDLFVLEQSGVAKKMTGQILEDWLVTYADGHGGIQSISKTGSTGTNPKIDTYTIVFADTTTFEFTVTNGVKGDTGAQTYVWIKWAPVQPTANNQMSSNPDKWIGIYVGTLSSAPSAYTSYTWYQWKGDKGDTGDSITGIELTNGDHTPGTMDTYTVYVEETAIGAFTVWNGVNGTGAVSSVNDVYPDEFGNVELTATDIGIGASSVVAGTDVANGAVGTADDYARGDHRHPLNVPISGTPAALGTASNGSSTNYARADHVHAMPTPANVGAMAEWELLWTNASPGSSFAEQDVPLSLTSYDMVSVFVVEMTSNNDSGAWFFGLKNHETRCLLMYNARQVRLFKMSDTGVHFGAGFQASLGNSLSTANDRAVPIFIYGIKGVS